MRRASTAALILAIAAGILRAQFVFFPPGDHLDEAIVASLSERAVANGRITANWDGFNNVEWSRPTFQFSPYTLIENASVVCSHGLFHWPVEPEDHIRFARWFSVALGGFAVLCCYFAALSWFGDAGIALVAELFLAVAFLHVQDSCYGRVEAMLSLSIGLAFFAAAAVMNAPSNRRCILLGLAIGLAVAVKYNAAPIVLLMFAPLLCKRLGEAGSAGSRIVGSSRSMAIIAGCSLIGFLVATPEVVVHPSPLIDGIRFELAHYSEGHVPHQAMDASDGNIKFWWNYLARLGFGWAPTLATIGFVVLAVRKRGRDAFLAVYIIVSMTLLLSWKVRFERNAEILLLPCCIAAAKFLIDCWGAIHPSNVSPFLRAALAIAVLGNVVQHSRALWDFRRQQRRSSSPLQKMPELIRVSYFLGQPIAKAPPPDWKDYPVLLLSGYSDAFSTRALAEWRERLKDWDYQVYLAPWNAEGYPFSTVETYHGPGFILRATKKPRSSP